MRKFIQNMPGVVLAGVLLAGLVSCKLFGRADHNPTAPAGSTNGANYAQMSNCPDCSKPVTVNGEQHQLNLALSDQPSFAYGEWFYAEINEQQGIGKAPGVDQVDVKLKNVVFTFSGLPAELTTMAAAIKTSPHPPLTVDGAVALSNCQNPGQNEDGSVKYCQFAVQNGSVAIPVAYADLSRFFGTTHYSVWFMPLGGANGNGVRCGSQLTASGTLPDVQPVSLSAQVSFGKAVCFGTNPPAPACVSYGGACTGDAECCEFHINACCGGRCTPGC